MGRSASWRVSAVCVLILAASSRIAAQDAPSAGAGVVAEKAAVSQTDSAPSREAPSYYLELGGFYSGLDNNYGSWKGADAKFGYTGSKRFAPFFTFSSQTRKEGSQQNFGGYSYLTFSKKVWAIVGAGGAPERNVVLYPKARVDGSVYIAVPKKPGLFLSAGFSDFFMPNGGGGRIHSVGTIYYHGPLIVSGSVGFNYSRPGNVPSQSGQVGFQYGSQGKHWFGAGLAVGKVAYQLVSLTPFDVRFNTAGVNAFYQQWIGRHWGVIAHYDYQDEVHAFQRHGLSGSAFFEF